MNVIERKTGSQGGAQPREKVKDVKQMDVSLFDKSPQAFFIIRVSLERKKKCHEFKIVYLNDALARLKAMEKEELLNKSVSQMFPESDRKWLKAFYEAAYGEKTVEMQIIAESMGRYMNMTCFPIKPGYCGCILDDYSGVLNPFYNSVYLVNLYADLERDVYVCVYLEESMQAKLPEYGLFSELAGRLIKSMVYLDDHEEFGRVLEKDYIRKHLQLKSDRDRENSYRIDFRTMQGGELRGCRMTVEAMMWAEDGMPHQVRIRLQDVTEERRKDEEHQKTVRKANAALQEAYEAARQAKGAKIDFLSQISHDIRTPMNAIIGMTAIAETHLGEPEMIKECLKKITISSHHLQDLIDEVFDMSQIESGKVTLNQAEFNLPDLLDTLLYMMKPQSENHGHKLTLKIEEIEHEDVIGDPRRIRQAFINIVNNAIEYTPDGGRISITVRERPTRKEKTGCFEFVFEDNGIGMSEEFLGKLFTPFERADDKKVTNIRGTGLGMAITKNLVNMMRGDIKVESELGKGSKFIVTIYLELINRKPWYENGRIDGERYEITTLIEADFSGRRILLVEDNELNREVLSKILATTGADIEEAENGKEAVERVSASPEGFYDIIFMDIRMPFMNGYEAADGIRALDREDTRKIPIIAMTANAFAEDVIAAKNAGMDEHIAKPIEFDKLEETLKKWLGKEPFGE